MGRGAMGKQKPGGEIALPGLGSDLTARIAERHRAKADGNLVVRVLAALVFGQIANAFQLREFSQQLLLDAFFQCDIDH